MFSSNEVTVKAFSLAPIKDLDGQTRIPVVVHTEQGGDLVSAGGGPLESNSKLHAAGIYPTNIFYVVDISSSMEERANHLQPESKLKLVQNRISGLIDALPKSIEHIVVPYNHNANLFQTTSPNKEIKQLRSYGDTNIHSGFEKVINYINHQTNPNHRNVILFFSDGHDTVGNSDETITKLTKQLRKLNTGIFLVGTGIGYNERLLKAILKSVQFGGQIHIPEDQGHINVFENILPKFANEICTALRFPIISFNSWFRKVTNLTPSTRSVDSENIDSSLVNNFANDEQWHHLPAIVGYQNQGFNVGFVNENDFDQAKVRLINQESSNSNPSSIDEVLITPLDNVAGLDSSTKKLIEQAPIQALINELIEKKDPKQIQEFLNNHPDLDQKTKTKLTDLANVIEQVTRNPSPQHTQTFFSSQSDSMSGFTQDTICGQLLPQIQSSPRNSGDTITGATANDTVTAISHNPDQNPAAIKFKFQIEPPVTYCLNKQVQDLDGFITLAPGQKINIGRSPDKNEIVFDNQNISKKHCQLLINNGQIVIKDVGSTNGVFINGSRIQMGNPVALSSGDRIGIGPITLILQQAA